jgi:hypothetical protein
MYTLRQHKNLPKWSYFSSIKSGIQVSLCEQHVNNQINRRAVIKGHMKKTLTAIGVAFLTAIGNYIASAQPVPCPDCPPCTNCPPYTNAPFIPTEYPTNALLIRQVQIMDGSSVIYTGPNWITDSNNLLIASSGGWTTNPPTDNVWTYVLGVTNSSPNLLYALQYRSALATAGTNVGNLFVGSTNGEVLLTNTIVNADPAGFWLLQQQPGFVIWSRARNKPQGMGQVENVQCPGFWSGYIDFTNGPVGGQYRVDTNAAIHSFTDFTRPTNAIEANIGSPLFACYHGTNFMGNTTPPTSYTTWCRVFIFLSADWPSNQDYPVWAQGFVSP